MILFDVNLHFQPVLVIPFYNGWIVQITPHMANGEVYAVVLPSWVNESVQRRIDYLNENPPDKLKKMGHIVAGIHEGEALTDFLAKVAAMPVEDKLAAKLAKVGKNG